MPAANAGLSQKTSATVPDLSSARPIENRKLSSSAAASMAASASPGVSP